MVTKLKQILLVALLVCTNFCINAALPKDADVLPMDPKVRYGVLSNGLTYFVVHNEEPKNRANFYIVQKVGSILEEEDQRGLAHFLEHMAFNGTTHFPGKAMLEYLQNNGIEFGRDINASTGFDVTNYFIANVNTKNQNLCDSVMLALYDWGNEISLLDEEIENERGVIHEEWRTRGDAQWRMWEKVLPDIYPGSKYANRLPIGTMDVVMHFKPETIRNYYETWYRPDQQGIIVVGDIDVDATEAKIKELFSKSQMPKNPKERYYAQVPDNKGMLYSLFTDPEASSTMVYIFFKHDVVPEAELPTMSKFRKDMENTLAQVIFSTRFEELSQNADCPFLGAYSYDSQYFISPTKDAYTLVGIAKAGQSKATFESLLRETRRVLQHGFTQSELDRAKATLIMFLQNAANESDKKNNSKWGRSISSHFTDGEQLLSDEYTLQLANELLPTLNLEDLNKYVASRISNDNVACIVSGPEGYEYPSKEEILASFDAILKESTTAYEDASLDTPLIEKEPVAGSVVSESIDNATGITTWKLSNGATVRLKPTDFKNDEIVLQAVSFGGMYAYNGNEALSMKVAATLANMSALGNYTQKDLNKYLADKNVSVSFALGKNSENIKGSCGVKDVETMLQLAYLYFTDIRKDEPRFEAYKAAMKAQLPSLQNNPDYIFSDSISSTIYNHNPMFTKLKVEDIDQIDYDHVLALVKDRLSNAGDFSFNFVGNFDLETIKPLVEKYIASIPDNGRREKVKGIVKSVSGKIDNVFQMPMENPKNSVYFLTSGNLKYSVENEYMLDMLSSVMDINYTATIREEEGGTYGVSTGAALDKYANQWKFIYTFDTNDEAQDRLTKRATTELYDMMKNGVPASTFTKVKENDLKNYETALRTNNYWLSVMVDYTFGTDNYTGYGDMIKNMTKAKLDKFIKSLNGKKNQIMVIMDGKAKK